jgi:hypothetical protein
MELRSIEAIIKALNTANVQYLIVGGLAVNAHGFARMTRDVDIVLHLDPANALRGLQSLFQIGYQMAVPARAEDFADSATREQWRTQKNMIVLKLWSDEHQRTPIDIFIYEPFDFLDELKHSLFIELGPDIIAPVVSLPTLLAMKRSAARPQDLIDIAELERIR